MKIEVNEHGTVVLKSVFTPIKLTTDAGENLIITMRDSGFEICYQNDFYELKKGVVSPYKHKDGETLIIENKENVLASGFNTGVDYELIEKAIQFVSVFGEDSLEIIEQTRAGLLYHPAQEPLFHAVESMVKTESNE